MLKADAMSVIECATANAVTTGHERAEPPQRDDEAHEKQQVIGAVEDVGEPELNESRARPDASAGRAG